MSKHDMIFNQLENEGYTKSPEVSLWLAVLERLLIDFNECLARKRFGDIKTMIRHMETPHMIWICETVGIHPDRITNYFYDRMTNRRQNTLDLRYKQTYREN